MNVYWMGFYNGVAWGCIFGVGFLLARALWKLRKILDKETT